MVCSGQSHQEAGEEGELQNLQGSRLKTRPFECVCFAKNKCNNKQRYEPAFTIKKSMAMKKNVLKDFDDISFASNITNFLHFQLKQMASELFRNSDHN